tara:strand:- start:45 stop:725 length:681 start_codon:yes stop_codon:yes gene_type:complete
MIIKKSKYLKINKLYFQNEKLDIRAKVEIKFYKYQNYPVKIFFKKDDEIIDEKTIEKDSDFFMYVETGKMNYQLLKEEKIIEDIDFKIPKTNLGNGMMKGCPVETPSGKKNIEDINVGDIVYNEKAEEIKVTGVFCWPMDPETTNYPIYVKHSNVGVKLPDCDIRFSWTHHFKVKRVAVTGRNLLLQNKAVRINLSETFYYYNIQTKNYEKILIAGFLSDSTNKRI